MPLQLLIPMTYYADQQSEVVMAHRCHVSWRQRMRNLPIVWLRWGMRVPRWINYWHHFRRTKHLTEIATLVRPLLWRTQSVRHKWCSCCPHRDHWRHRLQCVRKAHCSCFQYTTSLNLAWCITRFLCHQKILAVSVGTYWCNDSSHSVFTTRTFLAVVSMTFIIFYYRNRRYIIL